MQQLIEIPTPKIVVELTPIAGLNYTREAELLSMIYRPEQKYVQLIFKRVCKNNGEEITTGTFAPKEVSIKATQECIVNAQTGEHIGWLVGENIKLIDGTMIEKTPEGYDVSYPIAKQFGWFYQLVENVMPVSIHQMIISFAQAHKWEE